MALGVLHTEHPDPADLLRAALRYATFGWHVFPLHSITVGQDGQRVCTCGDRECGSPAKHPRTTDGFKSATDDHNAIAEWWQRWPLSNVGIRTGAHSGLYVLDIDTPKGGAGTLAQLERDHGKLPLTFTVLTGGGGMQFYFEHPGGTLANSVRTLGAGIDTRGDGGYVAAPPSLHVSGRLYKIQRDTELVPPPAWLLSLLTETRSIRAEPLSEGQIVREGEGRNNLLASLAGTMRRRGMAIDAIYAALLAENTLHCAPPLPEREVRTIAESVGRYPPTAPMPAPAPPAEGAGDTWAPIDLAELDDQPPKKPAPIGLYYPATRHLWSGEPESAKSWAALIVCRTETQAGNHVVYVDFETDPHDMKQRLEHLGATRDDLERFVYIRPSEPIGTAGVSDRIAAMLDQHRPTVVVVDAYAGALDIHDLDPYKTADIERFQRAFVEPLRRVDSAIIVLDHVVKNRENRGKFSIGSERKVGSVDVHLTFDTVAPFGRGRKGLFTVKVQKDRPGWLARPSIGTLELTSDPDTYAITWQLKQAAQDSDEWRPTALMEKVSRYLELQMEAVSRGDVEGAVTGKRDYVRKAVSALVNEGYIAEEHGPRNARMLTIARPYREDRDPKTAPRPDLAPTSPRAGSHDLAPLAPPSERGRAGSRGRHGGENEARPRPDDSDDYGPPELTRRT